MYQSYSMVRLRRFMLCEADTGDEADAGDVKEALLAMEMKREDSLFMRYSFGRVVNGYLEGRGGTRLAALYVGGYTLGVGSR